MDIISAFDMQNSEPKIIEFANKSYSIHPGGHLQGIQRIDYENKTHFVITGSSSDEAYFIVVGKNPNGYEIIQKKTIGKTPYRHAGGIQIMDNYLVVGIEDNYMQDISQVLIFDIKELDKPIGEPIIAIQRKGDRKRSTAGAVAIARLEKEYLLIVGSWDSDTLDFYKSNEKNLDELNLNGKSLCEFRYQWTWNKDNANRDSWIDKKWGNYQNLNLITDGNGNIFLIGYYYDEENSLDQADLFSISLNRPIPNMIKKESSKRMICKNSASFKYCGGCFVKHNTAIVSYACSASCNNIGVINEFE